MHRCQFPPPSCDKTPSIRRCDLYGKKGSGQRQNGVGDKYECLRFITDPFYSWTPFTQYSVIFPFELIVRGGCRISTFNLVPMIIVTHHYFNSIIGCRGTGCVITRLFSPTPPVYRYLFWRVGSHGHKVPLARIYMFLINLSRAQIPETVMNEGNGSLQRPVRITNA